MNSLSAQLDDALSSTNNAVAEAPETVVYLAQYQYSDEPGSYWPDKAFTNRLKAEQYANRVNCTFSQRVYSVTALILEGSL